MIDFIRVVFPTPFRPMRQTTFPAGIVRSTFRSTWLSPYETFNLSTVNIPFPSRPTSSRSDRPALCRDRPRPPADRFEPAPSAPRREASPHEEQSPFLQNGGRTPCHAR